MTLISQRKDIAWGKSNQSAEKNPNFQGGRYIDDKGYLRILAPKHPHANRGYVLAHRLVMEEYLGRYLEKWEVIHHINEIKLDNRIENFYLCTTKEHTEIHKTGKKKTLEQKTNQRVKIRKNLQNRKRDSGGRFTP